MANQWFRLYGEFSADPKVQMMSESDQRRLIMLMCLRSNGHVTLHDKEVTFLLRISNESWLITKAEFIANGFINNNNELLNWDKRQFVSDSSAARVAKHRANKKKECNVTVTPQNRTDTDTDTDTEQNKALSIFQIDLPLGDEVQKEVGSALETKPQSQKKIAIVEVFDYWRLIMNHKTAKLDAKREKVIGDALKIGYSVDQLKAAIMGCSITPFNCGVNDRNTRFDGLGVIFRSADHIDRFIQNSIQPIPQKHSNQQSVDRKYKVLN